LYTTLEITINTTGQYMLIFFISSHSQSYLRDCIQYITPAKTPQAAKYARLTGIPFARILKVSQERVSVKAMIIK